MLHCYSSAEIHDLLTTIYKLCVTCKSTQCPAEVANNDLRAWLGLAWCKEGRGGDNVVHITSFKQGSQIEGGMEGGKPSTTNLKPLATAVPDCNAVVAKQNAHLYIQPE